MKKINIIIEIGIGIIIVISGWIIFSNSNKVEKAIFQGEIGISQENIKEEVVVLVIDDGEGSPKSFQAEFNKGMTAFDLLKHGTEGLNLALKTKTYDMGIFVEAIGDKENGEEGKYWLYYVNGEMPMVAVDKQEIRPGDKIEFKFEKSSF